MPQKLYPFLTLTPRDDWKYQQVELGRGKKALDNQNKVRSQFKKFGLDHNFAFCAIEGTSRIFRSKYNGVEPISKFENSDELRRKGQDIIGQIRLKLKNESKEWQDWFEAIFENLSLYSDGSDIVFVWGVQLKEKERFIPSPNSTGLEERSEEGSEKGPKKGPKKGAGNESAEGGEQEGLGQPPSGGGTVVQVPSEDRPWLTWLLWLLILVLFFIFLWLVRWCCTSCNRVNDGFVSGGVYVNPLPDRLPENPNVSVPWNPEDVRQDSVTGQTYLNDRWNIAFTEADSLFDQFVLRVDSLIPAEDGELIYWDPVIGRVQCLWKSEEPFPVTKLKKDMAGFRALIWPERLMYNGALGYSADTTTTEPTWHFKAIGWERVEPDTSNGVGLAVVDDGFDLAGSGLEEVSRFPLNVETREANVTASEFRIHGTHVASLAVAPEQSRTVFQGVSCSSLLIPVQLQSRDTEGFSMSNIVDGILYASRKGARVINLSLGSEMSHPWWEMSEAEKWFLLGPIRQAFLEERLFWRHLFQALEDEGVVVVVAAGNDGAPLEWDPMHESAYPIYVTATLPDGSRAPFSNFKSSGNDSLLAVAAPGFQVHSYIPGGDLMPINGTSMAAPIVAGAICEFMAQHGAVTPAQMRKKLQQMPLISEATGRKLWIPSLIQESIEL